VPNALYRKGVRKERLIVNNARAKGYISFRSAGSHSPIDVCIIDAENRNIYFVQCKSDNLPESAKVRLKRRFEGLQGTFNVRFEVD
jgi:Holliday junction resolvase